MSKKHAWDLIAYSKSHRTSEQEKYRKNWGQTEHRMRADGIANTLSAGDGGSNMSTANYAMKDMKIRRLTPTECERLMSWPDGWTIGSDTQRYKQCGNGVVSSVVQAVIERMKPCLN